MAKILVVDDIEDNVKLLEYDLGDDGYEVAVAFDGEEGIEKARSEKPDVILLDIMMPGIDGIETCRRLKADPELAQIPVIMLSAKNQDEDIVRGLDVGAQDYISKPLNYPIVAARVRSAVRVKDQEDSMRRLNSKLNEAKLQAESSLRAKSTFLATMSHEIRTPITAIMGLAEILAGDDNSGPFDQGHASKAILSNSRYLLEAINNILDLSKVESGHLNVEQIRCSLFDVLKDVDAVVNLKAIEKDLDFYIDYEYPLPATIESDPTRLKQILINLAANAVKFTKEGSVRISVRCLKDKEQLQIDVSDTGIGMSEPEIDRLFQPFSQVNDSITRRFGGTGLGLSISHQLIEKLNGSIEVKSEKGTGSLFRVVLPTGPLEEVEELQNNPTLQSEAKALNSFRFKGRALIVEDEHINQRLIAHFLGQLGLEVELAEDGECGMQKAMSEEFDIILMDMHLPKICGAIVTKRLREENIKTPIIALTASQSKEGIETLLQAGCEEYIGKPFERRELVDCLKRYLVSESAPELCIDKDNRYVELVLQYVSSMPERLKHIESAHELKDFDLLREKAHCLAGAGLFGFPEISLTARLLEEQAQRSNPGSCRELVARLRIEINAACSERK